jgi:hypothetical protein
MMILVGWCDGYLLVEFLVPTSVGMNIDVACEMLAKASTTDGLTTKLTGR